MVLKFFIKGNRYLLIKILIILSFKTHINFNQILSLTLINYRHRSESVRSNFLSTNTSSRMSSYHGRHRKSTASVTPLPSYKVPQQLQQMTSSKSFACEQGTSSKELDMIAQPKSSRSFFKKCKSRLMKTFSSVSNAGNSQKKTVCQDLSIL